MSYSRCALRTHQWSLLCRMWRVFGVVNRFCFTMGMERTMGSHFPFPSCLPRVVLLFPIVPSWAVYIITNHAFPSMIIFIRHRAFLGGLYYYQSCLPSMVLFIHHRAFLGWFLFISPMPSCRGLYLLPFVPSLGGLYLSSCLPTGFHVYSPSCLPPAASIYSPPCLPCAYQDYHIAVSDRCTYLLDATGPCGAGGETSPLHQLPCHEN